MEPKDQTEAKGPQSVSKGSNEMTTTTTAAPASAAATTTTSTTTTYALYTVLVVLWH